MINVLITGGDGQLAKCFASIVGGFPQYNIKFPGQTVVDICNIETLEAFVVKHQIQAIINTAAFTQVDEAEEQQTLATLVNVEGLRNCVKIAEKYKLKLIHFSTDYVFDGTQEGYSEEDAVNPLNFYGETKLKSEKIIQKAMAEAIVIRISWLFSPFGKNFVKTILRFIQERDALKVVNDQWGRPTYGIHLAETVLQMLSSATVFKEKRYHFANAGKTNWFEFANAIVKCTNFEGRLTPVRSEEFPTKARRPKNSVLRTERLEKVLGKKIPSWEVALSDCIKKIEAHESV